MTDQMYGLYAREYEEAIIDNIYNAHLERPSMLSMLPDLQGKTVLDLGCGPGIYAEYLLSQGAIVTASDISPEMVNRVTTRFAGKVVAYLQDLAEGLPKEADSYYDLIISPLTIHYLEDPLLLFSDVRRSLKSDGSFFFSTHHPMVDFQSSPSGNYFIRELVKDEWNTIGKPVKVQFYRRSLTELFQIISDAGMYVASLSEGKPSESMRSLSPESYQHLSHNPNFLFMECKPLL